MFVVVVHLGRGPDDLLDTVNKPTHETLLSINCCFIWLIFFGMPIALLGV